MILEVDATLGVVTPELDATFPSNLKGNFQVRSPWGEVGSGARRRKASVTLLGAFTVCYHPGQSLWSANSLSPFKRVCVCTCGCPELTNQARQMAEEVPFLSLWNKAVNNPGEQIAGECSGSDVSCWNISPPRWAPISLAVEMGISSVLPSSTSSGNGVVNASLSGPEGGAEVQPKTVLLASKIVKHLLINTHSHSLLSQAATARVRLLFFPF